MYKFNEHGTKVLHREHNLPAIMWFFGENNYYVNGKLHRTNGPAIDSSWFFHGEQVDAQSKSDYLKKVKQLNKLQVFT